VTCNLERRVSITGETYAALSRNKSSVLIYIYYGRNVCGFAYSNENGRKNSISTFVSIFLAETESGSENAGLETESRYADARKRQIQMESQKIKLE
jgi:hypothetical protein